MLASKILGLVLILLGILILFLLRDTLIAIIVFAIEFLGIVVAFVLILAGIALLYGGSWTWWTGRRAFSGLSGIRVERVRPSSHGLV